jgi:hypothetical protein
MSFPLSTTTAAADAVVNKIHMHTHYDDYNIDSMCVCVRA